MERKKGFLQIKEYELIRTCQREIDGKYCVAWIILDGFESLYKEYQNINTCYKEVFWSYALTELGIPNVEYDLASNQGKLGVITKNAKQKDQKIKNLSELIQNFRHHASLEYRHSSLSDLFNVKELEKIFVFHYSQLKPEELKKLNESLLKQFIIQILSGNCDLHDRNMIIVEKPMLDFFPYFDFGGYSLTSFKIMNHTRFCLPYIKSSYMEEPKQTVGHFLDYATKQEIELLKYYIEKFLTLDTTRIYEHMENDLSFTLPRNVKKDLSRKLVRNSIYIEKQMRNSR